MQKSIKQQLEELAEEDYRLFSTRLLPNIDNVLGVRLPELRKMAKVLAREDWKNNLQTVQNDTFEEIMLQGMVIGCVTCDPEERLSYIQEFVPKIGNWSVCDSFCASLKFAKDNQERVWEFLQPHFSSKQEFEVRFAVVMLIFYYIDEMYVDKVLNILDKIRHEGYYVKMAVAWAISICFIQLPERTMIYLKNNQLDDFTYNKALQKITESLKVSKDAKQCIRAMKRKGDTKGQF